MRKTTLLFTLLLLVLTLLLSSCSKTTDCQNEKLPVFDESEEYEFLEFCIPNSAEVINEVHEMVPDGLFVEEYSGIAGCDITSEVLVEIDLNTPQEKLCELSELDYVREIVVTTID